MIDYSSYKYIRVKKEDRIIVISMNRPEVLNAVNAAMHVELEDIWVDINKDEDVNVAILTAEGRAFCSGGDLKEMSAAFGLSDPWVSRTPMEGARRLILNMIDVDKPIIAAVNGDALALGATLALFCDIIIAVENARFGDVHVSSGALANGDGGAIIWPLLIGMARAKQYLLTGDLVDAREAERIGLINVVVPPDKLMDEAMALARRLALGAQRPIRYTKRAVNKKLRDEVNLTLDAGLALEYHCFYSQDHQEAATAFNEKRAPRYKQSLPALKQGK